MIDFLEEGEYIIRIMDQSIKNSFDISIAIIFFKEGEYIVAYSPALELSSYGKTEEEAKIALEEAVGIFLEETIQKGTLERILIKLGWTISKKQYEPPKYSPEELFALYKSQPPLNVLTERIPIAVPL